MIILGESDVRERIHVSGTWITSHFRTEDEPWTIGDTTTDTSVKTDTDTSGRTDEYITADYDVRDGTFSLTYHPAVRAVTTPCFTPAHAAIALKDAGFSFPQLTKILDDAKRTGMMTDPKVA